MEVSKRIPSVQEHEEWAKNVWRLKNLILIAYLNHDQLFMDFGTAEEARRVLEIGRRSVKGDFLELDR